MKLGQKELIYGKKKFILIESILILMTFMVLFLSGLANGLSQAVSSAIEKQSTKEYLLSSDAQDLITLSAIDDSKTKEILNQNNKNAATLNIYRGHLQQKSSSTKLDVTYFAIDTDSFLNPNILTGKKLSSAQNAIVLDDAYMDDGIKIGDTITDSDSGLTFQVTGFTKDAMYGHTSAAYISTENYTKMLQVKNPQYTPTTQVIAFDKTPVLSFDSAYTLVNKTEIINHIPGYEAEQSTIQMILWVLLFMSTAILGVFFYILTIQKERQYGVLKAVGMHMKEVTALIASQVFILAFIGMLIGNILTYLMSIALPKSMPFYLQTSSILLISAVFLVVSVLGSLISTLRIAKVDPIITIGGNES